MIDTLIAVGIGVFAGVASGIAGVGGGVLMVPGMVFLLGLPQPLAQGTSLLAILFTSVSGTVVNVKNGHTRVAVASLVGLGGLASAQVGKSIALAIDPDLLQRLFGVLVLVSGIRMLVKDHTPRLLALRHRRSHS